MSKLRATETCQRRICAQVIFRSDTVFMKQTKKRTRTKGKNFTEQFFPKPIGERTFLFFVVFVFSCRAVSLFFLSQMRYPKKASLASC